MRYRYLVIQQLHSSDHAPDLVIGASVELFCEESGDLRSLATLDLWKRGSADDFVDLLESGITGLMNICDLMHPHRDREPLQWYGMIDGTGVQTDWINEHGDRVPPPPVRLT